MKLAKKLCSLMLCLSFLPLASCGMFEGDIDDADANLYHLTLSYSENVANLEEFKQEDLKATYGYGEPSQTVVEGIRPEEEIQALRKLGVSEEDLSKVGKRQSDGSYYFFFQDFIYLEAPVVTGYKLKGFYHKGDTTGASCFNPSLTETDGVIALPRWNMTQKDIELEARYEKCSYQYYFNEMERLDINPNTNGTYCYIDEGEKFLLPASSPHKTFIRWEYENTANYVGEHAEWISLEKVGDNFKLPIDYYEDQMRLQPVWDINEYEINFEFVHQIDNETFEPLTFEQSLTKLLVHGNLSTVDGDPVYCENDGPKTEYKKESELKTQYGSWLDIFPTVNSQYKLWAFKINNGENIIYYDEIGYMSLNIGDICEDTTITLILVDNI